MIERAVVVPHPPLLVPELVTGAVVETGQVRRHCVEAAARLAAVAPVWIAVAADPSGPRSIEPDAVGTFRGYGVDIPVRLARARNGRRPDPLMPLPALVAGWLRGQVGGRRVRVELVPPDLPAQDCRLLGAHLASQAAGEDHVGLLVLGDGPVRRAEHATGSRDDAPARRFDQELSRTLAAADPHALLRLDPVLAEDLGAVGRAAWQVLAGAALSAGGTETSGSETSGTETSWRGEVLYCGAPYGIGYHVAVWDPR